MFYLIIIILSLCTASTQEHRSGKNKVDPSVIGGAVAAVLVVAAVVVFVAIFVVKRRTGIDTAIIVYLLLSGETRVDINCQT